MALPTTAQFIPFAYADFLASRVTDSRLFCSSAVVVSALYGCAVSAAGPRCESRVLCPSPYLRLRSGMGILSSKPVVVFLKLLIVLLKRFEEENGHKAPNSKRGPRQSTGLCPCAVRKETVIRARGIFPPIAIEPHLKQSSQKPRQRAKQKKSYKAMQPSQRPLRLVAQFISRSALNRQVPSVRSEILRTGE